MNDIMNAYPVQRCESEEKDGTITVLVKKPYNFLEKIFFKKMLNKPFRIDLDKIGSFVWKHCNGEFSVKEIAELCKEEFGNDVEPAEARVKLFIEQMNRNRMIQLFIKAEDRSKDLMK